MTDFLLNHPLASSGIFLVLIVPVAFLFACASTGQFHVWVVDRLGDDALKAKYRRTWTYRTSKWFSVRIYKDSSHD